uniref:Uncharacterized protein n=1 Tax=Cucumis melo TaxID=3656 RepID=A0A9I9E6E4_CUCME
MDKHFINRSVEVDRMKGIQESSQIRPKPQGTTLKQPFTNGPFCISLDISFNQSNDFLSKKFSQGGLKSETIRLDAPHNVVIRSLRQGDLTGEDEQPDLVIMLRPKLSSDGMGLIQDGMNAKAKPSGNARRRWLMLEALFPPFPGVSVVLEPPASGG